MKASKTVRGFIIVEHPCYTNPDVSSRVIQESSAVGDSADAVNRPGSSFLWVGDDVHLNREEVVELIGRMQWWVDTGRLVVDDDGKAVQE